MLPLFKQSVDTNSVVSRDRLEAVLCRFQNKAYTNGFQAARTPVSINSMYEFVMQIRLSALYNCMPRIITI